MLVVLAINPTCKDKINSGKHDITRVIVKSIKSIVSSGSATSSEVP